MLVRFDMSPPAAPAANNDQQLGKPPMLHDNDSPPALARCQWAKVASSRRKVKNSPRMSKKFIRFLYFAAQSPTNLMRIYWMGFAWSSNCSLSRKHIPPDGGMKQ